MVGFFAMGSDNIMLAAGKLLVNAEIPECLEKVSLAF